MPDQGRERASWTSIWPIGVYLGFVVITGLSSRRIPNSWDVPPTYAKPVRSSSARIAVSAGRGCLVWIQAISLTGCYSGRCPNSLCVHLPLQVWQY